MECRLETITPKKAQEFLKLNTFNRPISQKHVDFLAGAMTRGEWRITGDTIKMNGEVLVDGQHRLYAIIKSGVAIQSYVARGLSDNTYGVIDQGKGRTVADHFGRSKEEHYTTLACAARWIYCYEHDANFALPVTPLIADSVVISHRGIRDAVNAVRGYKLRGMIGYGAAGGLLTIMAEKDESAASTFWNQVGIGENLTKTMPSYVIRQRMIENSAGHKKVRMHVVYAMVIKAWNMFRDKQPCKLLRWTEDESFPIAK